MSDVASLRAEIKYWERSFKAANGREPTIDDIKKQPVVAQKYKSYKKLSKAAAGAAASGSSLAVNDLPSTPIRPTSSRSSKLLHSASRVIETTASLKSFNPFSPQKNKGKQKETSPSNIPRSTLNPFASPRKSKSQSSRQQPSPDPFPLIVPSQSSISNKLLPEPPSPVSRARKRLRGEPVSPSPNKVKRPRVLSQTNLPFPKLELQEADGDNDYNEDEWDDKIAEGHPSFVDDSPMKPAASGKQFTLLFAETVKPTSMTDIFGSSILTTTKSRPSSRVLSKDSLLSKDEEILDADSESSSKSSKKAPSSKPRSSAPTKSRSKLVQMTLPTAGKASDGFQKEAPPDVRTSIKCLLTEMDPVRHDSHDDPDSTPDPSSIAPQLLPPSPKLNASRISGKSKLSGARSHQPPKNASRKKARLQGEESAENMDGDDGSGSDSLDAQRTVKLVHHSRGIRAAAPTEEGDSEIEDSILNYARRVLPRGKGSVSPAKQVVDSPFGHGPGEEKGEGREGADGEERVEGLPHELHRVLVLESLKSKRNEIEEEKIVKELLSGRRIMHYNPGKGGEIWGVGEDDGNVFVEDRETGIDERGDEWEGEPVPWEVGELSESHYHSEEL